MRKLILKIAATASSFYVAQYALAGVHIDATWSAYLIASLVFVVFNLVLGPIIRLLLLPINLLTLGLFRWVSGVLVLYLFDLLYDGIRITAFTYQGYNSALLALPAGHLNLFWVLVLTSLIMSFTYALTSALFRSEE